MSARRIAAAVASAGLIAATGAYSAEAAPKYPQRVLWGDEHVHTGWSADAGLGGTTLGPEDAVRFALGAAVTSSSGQNAKLQVPLDWVAVADHSDGMGTINQLHAGNAEFLADPTAKRWYEMMNQGGEAGRTALIEAVNAQSNHQLPSVFMDPKWMVSAWTKTIDIMDRYNQPGKFTAFISYEWTSNGEGGDNLHRNVILRDDGARARQVLPLTTFQSPDPATLWQWMADYETKTGGQAPTFLIAAMKDPAGANLDRAQIVKGWVDAAGKTQEAIYDVVWSDPGKSKPVNGKLPAVGNTVDLKTATYSNSIGAPELIGRFKDPNFDPRQRAFYYVRVLKIPTPRWTAYDAVRYNVTMTPDVTMVLQERAVTSPIWYDPS